VKTWMAPSFSYFYVGGPSSSCLSGGTISGMGCMVSQAFATRGNQSHQEFQAITGRPRYRVLDPDNFHP
jgi:hypothetical protein